MHLAPKPTAPVETNTGSNETQTNEETPKTTLQPPIFETGSQSPEPIPETAIPEEVPAPEKVVTEIESPTTEPSTTANFLETYNKDIYKQEIQKFMNNLVYDASKNPPALSFLQGNDSDNNPVYMPIVMIGANIYTLESSRENIIKELSSNPNDRQLTHDLYEVNAKLNALKTCQKQLQDNPPALGSIPNINEEIQPTTLNQDISDWENRYGFDNASYRNFLEDFELIKLSLTPPFHLELSPTTDSESLNIEPPEYAESLDSYFNRVSILETDFIKEDIQLNNLEQTKSSIALLKALNEWYQKTQKQYQLLIEDQKQAPPSPTEPLRRLTPKKAQEAPKPEFPFSYEKAVDEYLESYFDFSSLWLDIYASPPDRATAIERGMDLVTFLFQLNKAPKDVPLETINDFNNKIRHEFWAYIPQEPDTNQKLHKAYNSLVEKHRIAIHEKSKFLKDDDTNKKLQTTDILKMKQLVDSASQLYPNETLDIKTELKILNDSIRITTDNGKSTVHLRLSLGSENLTPYEYAEKFKAFYTSALYFDMQSSDPKKYEESIKRYLARIKAIDIWYNALPQIHKQPSQNRK